MALLQQRLDKVLALPASDRSQDVDDFILCSHLLDEALALLRPTLGAPQDAADAVSCTAFCLALRAWTLFIEPVHYQGAWAHCQERR